MPPDIIDGYRLRDLQRTVKIGRATLVNELSVTILVIEDCGRRTFVHPDVNVKTQPSITVSWATDCDDTNSDNKVKIIEDEDFHVVNLGRATKLKLKYLQSLPATIVVGAVDANVSNALLRDMGKSLHPICLSEDKDAMGKWVIAGTRYGPVVFQAGAGRLTVISPETLATVDEETVASYLFMKTETACREHIRDMVKAQAISVYYSTMSKDYAVDQGNTQSIILNEHKIMAEETKHEGVQLQVAKTAVDTISRLAS